MYFSGHNPSFMNTDLSSEAFAREIDKVIEKNIYTYQNDPDRITSDYRGERGLTEAYNGRQLLELLQNADDAKTDQVLVNLDTQSRILSIFNNGDPFDIKGVKALMLANTSSKNKREFIGNKGLGFRSILNWVTKVSIKTKNTTLVFSPEIARIMFEKIIPDETVRQTLIDKEKDLQAGEVPFAVLAMPQVYTNNDENLWTTVIEVEYKNDIRIENSIKKQLEEIKPETLLFLNNINVITITGAGKHDKTLKLDKFVINDEQYMQVGDARWQLFDSGELMISKAPEKYYRYKIAWKHDLSDIDTKFFTYFPTEVHCGLPYLIHATFDLDPSRKQLNNTDDNVFILKDIAQTLGQLAITKLRQKIGDWQAYRFFLADVVPVTGMLKPFYDRLHEFTNTLSIFPCLDGKYYKLHEVQFYNNEFSYWIIQNSYNHIFNDLLLPIPTDLPIKFAVNQYNNEIWWDKINEIGSRISSLSKRVDLISLLIQDVFRTHNKRYSLLINDNGDIIPAETLVFTPIIQADGEFSKPRYLEFDFINRSLYSSLITRHKSLFEKGEPDSREFQRLFKELFNIQPYDSNNVISRIISGTRRELAKRSTDSAPEIVKEMVMAIFKNFKSLKDKQELFTETFPLLSIQDKVRDAADLHLSTSFPSGKGISNIYSGILTAEDYVHHVDYWELGDDTDHIFKEAFFIWMGVNRYARFEKEEFQIKQGEDHPYKNYVLSKIKVPDKVTYYKFQGLRIANLSKTIGLLSTEKLIVLIKNEDKILSRIGLNNPDMFYHTYGHSYFQPFNEKPSYISFQLNHLKSFYNYLVEDYEIPFIESFSFNSYESFFKQNGLSEEDVKTILLRLGAKRSFLDFDLKKVFELINECARLRSPGTIARKLYRLAFDNFRRTKNGNFVNYHSSLKLLATKAGIKEYRQADEIYYSDNNTLPTRLVEDYWIFDFPKRSGEKQIAEYFGVKTFKDIVIKIVDNSVKQNTSTANEFVKWVEKIKPFILTHRLNIENSTSIEKNSASAIKNTRIELVSEARYQVNNGESKILLPGEFLNLGNNRFVICGEHGSSLAALKSEPAFSEAFAEVCCVLFEVNEGKDHYRNVFKDGENLKDTLYLITSKSLNDKLKMAFKLVGLLAKESIFWDTIFTITGHKLGEQITGSEQLLELLNKIEYNLPLGYSKVDFDNFNNKESFELLKSVCEQIPNVTLQHINTLLPDFPGLKEWHLQCLANEIVGINSLYAKALWRSFKNSDFAVQRTFNSCKIYFSKYCNNLTWNELNSFQFIIDYELLVKQKVEAQFNINLDNALTEMTPTVIYSTLLNKFGIEEAALEQADQSLLYFEGHEDYFVSLFQEIKQTETSLSIIEDDTILNKFTLKFSAAIDGKVPNYRLNAQGMGGKGQINNDHSTNERQKKRAGKRAERLTRDTLMATYDVKWISSNSDQADVIKNDSAGYDMEYRKKGTQQWLFLEVKSMSSNCFILSLNEVRRAIDEKEKYHLCLVKGNELNLITDFFLDVNRLSAFDQLLSCSSIIPTDFEVYVNLDPIHDETDTV